MYLMKRLHNTDGKLSWPAGHARS